jgi:hypothetical protein
MSAENLPAPAPPNQEPPQLPQPAKPTFAPPAVLAIGFYLLILAVALVIGVVGHHYPPLLLLLSAAFFTVCGGLVLLLRWAWAGALSAVFCFACYNLWIFSMEHMGAALVQGLLNLVFFLYLIRTEVREKLR